MHRYLNLTREVGTLRNMRLKAIPIVIGALESVSKDLKRLLKNLENAERWILSKLKHY